MQAVILDADSLGDDIDLTPLQRDGLQWQIYNTTQPDQTLHRIAQADIVVCNKVLLDAQCLSQAPALKLISVAATGTNNIDLQVAAAQGISVSNCVDYGSASVAQHVFTLMLALANNLPAYQADVAAGRWQQSPFFCLLDHPIIALNGATLGIIGYGNIAKAVEKIARAFDMRVMVLRRKRKKGDPDLQDVLRESDFLSLHCPLTPQTQGLIGEEQLKQMKPSAFLINCARGGIVDEQALVTALRKKTIAGAALDVLEQEPPVVAPLPGADLANLIVTPHIAWASQKARQTVVKQIAENIAAFLAGAPRRVVN